MAIDLGIWNVEMWCSIASCKKFESLTMRYCI